MGRKTKSRFNKNIISIPNQHCKFGIYPRKVNESRYHRIIHPNIYAKVKALAKAEGISDDEAYDRIMYNLTYR